MIIDILFILVLIFAIFKGINKGLVVGIFSLLAFIIGLAAALKLSVIVADYLKKNVTGLTKWLPLISFLLVFVLIIILVSFLGKMIKKALHFAMLGWLDSLGGMVFYIILNTIIFSIFLFYAEKIMILQPGVIVASKTYPYISPWGPKVINNLGNIIPVFKNMFAELETFFDGVAKKAA